MRTPTLLLFCGLFALSGCQFLLNANPEALTEADHCDDGVDNDGDDLTDCEDDQCDPICERCGDLEIQAPQEECDDGNNLSGDGCQANCTLPLDLAVVNEGARTISLFQSDGPLALNFVADVPLVDQPTQAVFADLNEDTLPDLIVTGLDQDRISVLLAQSAGVFGAPQTFTTQDRPTALLAHDFNADGHLDILCANAGDLNIPGTTLSRFFGDGLGGLTAAADIPVGEGPNELHLVDRNRNGVFDRVLVNNREGESVSVLSFDQNGDFTTEQTIDLEGKAVSITAADLNNDQNLDIVGAVLSGGVGRLVVVLLNGNLAERSKVAFNIGAPISTVTAIELTQDQTPELAVYRNTPSEVLILENNGNGFFNNTLLEAPTPGFGAQHITADLNGDGAPELLTTNSLVDSISVLFFEGGSFGAPTDIITGANPRFLLTGQLLP